MSITALPAGALSRADAAKYLTCSVRYVDKQVKAGQLAKCKLGARTVFTKEELDRFLASKKQVIRPEETAKGSPQIPAVTEGIYQLTIHDGSRRDVRVFEVSGELRMCFIDSSEMPCKDSATMLVTMDLELYRSPEQESKDLSRIARTRQGDVGSQLNRISEIASKLASNGERSWQTVAELKRLYSLLQQVIEEM